MYDISQRVFTRRLVSLMSLYPFAIEIVTFQISIYYNFNDRFKSYSDPKGLNVSHTSIQVRASPFRRDVRYTHDPLRKEKLIQID